MASDLIYREDAKDFVRHAYNKGLNPMEYLDEVPTADVRPVNNRYIDGDELFRRIAGHSYYSGDDILTRICLMQEGKSPKNKSIEPANVRRVVRAMNKSEDGFLCSACSFGDFGGFHGYKPNFCPNCGADMRVE